MERLCCIEVFVRVMDCGSFSRTAESLDVLNASVTSNLPNLESAPQRYSDPAQTPSFTPDRRRTPLHVDGRKF